jgi:signal transduction histidine kinase
MRFERKIFIAVFCSTFLIGSLLIWVGHHYASTKSREDFVSRYSVFNRVLSDTLTRLDTSTESLMLDAAKVVVARDAQKGLLSTDELKAMSAEIGMTHIFVVNKDGTFIRSTNEDPRLIPNLYSFSQDYRRLLQKGTYNKDATPIIQPMPEPKPYKFLFLPNSTRSRIIEVGVRVDSIAKTLMEAIKADPNVVSMSLYSPNGAPFGTFSADKVVFDGPKAPLPENLSVVIDDADSTHFYSKVTSSHTHCSQCDVSGTSSHGEYYYVLESSVSKSELNAIQARMRWAFVLLALLNLALAFGVAKLLSRRLVKNIRVAVERVRSIKASGDVTARIGIQGEDEVAFLTKEFDKLLDQREEAQDLLIEAEKTASKVQLARVVAHNIRSPIIAIEMMIPQLFMLTDRTRRVLTNSVNEIKELAEQLKSKPESVTVQSSSVGQVGEQVFIPVLVEDVVNQKQIEYGNRPEIQISFVNELNDSDVFSKASGIDLRSVISNLVNNAVESYGEAGGSITVVLSASDRMCTISVIDQGCGVSTENMNKLGQSCFTSKFGGDGGLGLVHATQTANSWGGRVRIQSEVEVGTRVTLEIPRNERSGLLRRIVETVAR